MQNYRDIDIYTQPLLNIDTVLAKNTYQLPNIFAFFSHPIESN